MYWYSISSENKSPCIIRGDNVRVAINNNPNVIKYYIGRQSKVIRIDVEETNDKSLRKYRVIVDYVRHSKTDNVQEMILWVDEMVEPKML